MDYNSQCKDKAVLDLIAEGYIEKSSRRIRGKIAMSACMENFLIRRKKLLFIMHLPGSMKCRPTELQIDLTIFQILRIRALLSSGSEKPAFFPLLLIN